MNWRMTRWLLPAIVLIVAGLLSIIAQVFILPGDVKPEDWERAAIFVAEHIGPEDVINIQPNWSEAPYPYLTEVGDQILRQDKPLLEDVFDRENLWVIVESGRLARTIDEMPFPAAETHPFDTISVVRIAIPSPGPVLYELREHLSDAQVSQIGAAGEVKKDCSHWNPRKRAWSCGRPNPWIYVGENFLTLGLDPHRCIWANPPEAPLKWQITYPDVPLGHLFRLRAGIDFVGARSRRGTDVELNVRVGDHGSESRTIPARETSWNAIDFDTSSIAGQRADVTIEIGSESVFDRFVCFNGWSLNPSPQ